jgi:hypothetical protein
VLTRSALKDLDEAREDATARIKVLVEDIARLTGL